MSVITCKFFKVCCCLSCSCTCCFDVFFVKSCVIFLKCIPGLLHFIVNFLRCHITLSFYLIINIRNVTLPCFSKFLPEQPPLPCDQMLLICLAERIDTQFLHGQLLYFH